MGGGGHFNLAAATWNGGATRTRTTVHGHSAAWGWRAAWCVRPLARNLNGKWHTPYYKSKSITNNIIGIWRNKSFLYWPCFARCRHRQVYDPYRWILYNIHRTMMSRRNCNRYSPSILMEWYFRHPGLATGLSALRKLLCASRFVSAILWFLRSFSLSAKIRYSRPFFVSLAAR